MKKSIYTIALASILAICILIISMSFFGAEGFNWFGGFKNESEKAKNSISITTWSFVVVGIGLSIAGCAMQGVTRNSLASAYSLGSIASSLFSILLVKYVFNIQNVFLTIILTILFSILLSSIFLTIFFSNKISHTKVIVIGIIFSIFISSLTYLFREKYNLTSEMISFISIDSFNGTWNKFKITTPIILISCFVLFVLGKHIQIFESDPDKAKVLGINIKLLRWAVSFFVIFIASSSVYLIGPISFIGILIPSLSNMILQNEKSTRRTMILSIPLSIIVLLVAQILTRQFYSYGFNINVLISLIAGPIVIYKIVRGNYV